MSSIFGSYGWVAIANTAVRAVRPDAKFEGPTIPPRSMELAWLKEMFVGAGFGREKVNVYQERVWIRKGDMSEEAKHHFCEAVVLQASVGWSESEREALMKEMLKVFSAEWGSEDGFEHLMNICVAEK